MSIPPRTPTPIQAHEAWYWAPDDATSAADPAADPTADPAADPVGGKSGRRSQSTAATAARAGGGTAAAAGRRRPLRRLVRHLHSVQIGFRTVACVSVLTLTGAALLVGGFEWGSFNAALAPVRVQSVADTTGLTVPERVYDAAHGAVVTITVPGGALGSGFFYRPDRIVTNNHVVASSTAYAKDLAAGQHPSVLVTLADGQSVQGAVQATDPRLDLAIVDVTGDLGITPLSFADSSTVVPGEEAVALGSPFGLANTVTDGLVSGTNRDTPIAEDAVQADLMQTSAPINPGNSGGPLLDSSAGVIGIVTLRPDTEAGRPTQGVAFALPSAAVVAAISQLERYGKVSHPELGVTISPAAGSTTGSTAAGAVIDQVTPGSPAAKAGLRPADVLLAVDGQQINTPADLVNNLLTHRAGDTVTLTLRRNGTVLTEQVTLAERPATP
jgi:putative serine protease PepD